jgi:hypothetical protein
MVMRVTMESNNPGQQARYAFKALVANCIEAFRTFYDDTLSLDLNRITDSKVRAMILRDSEYQRETKYIRAEKTRRDIQDLDELVRLAADMGSDAYDPRDAKNGARQGKAATDKDTLNMRFKAAQEKRSLLKELADQGSDELDAMNMFFVPVAADELERMDTIEMFAGDGDADSVLGDLAGQAQEKLPVGTKVNDTHIRANSRKGSDEAPAFKVDSDGDIVLAQ